MSLLCLYFLSELGFPFFLAFYCNHQWHLQKHPKTLLLLIIKNRNTAIFELYKDFGSKALPNILNNMKNSDTFILKTHLFINSNRFVENFVKKFEIPPCRIKCDSEKLNRLEILTLAISILIINLFKFIYRNRDMINIKEILNREFYKITIKKR